MVKAKTGQDTGIFGSSSDLIECMAEDIFETAEVPLDQLITLEEILKVYQKDPSLISKFC